MFLLSAAMESRTSMARLRPKLTAKLFAAASRMLLVTVASTTLVPISTMLLIFPRNVGLTFLIRSALTLTVTGTPFNIFSRFYKKQRIP